MRRIFILGVAGVIVTTASLLSADQRWISGPILANKTQVAILADTERMTDVIFFSTPAPNASVAQNGNRFSTSDPGDLAWLRTLVASTAKPWVRVEWVDPATNQPATNVNVMKFWRWGTIRGLQFVPASGSNAAFYLLWAEGQDPEKPTTIKSMDVPRINGLIAATKQPGR